MPSVVVTARIPFELKKKIDYLEIDITQVIRDSLTKAVTERERELEKFKDNWRQIRGLNNKSDNPEITEGLSGEELKRARITLLAKLRKEARKNAEKIAHELDNNVDL